MSRGFASVRPSFVVLVVGVVALAFWGGRAAVRAQGEKPTEKPKAVIEGAWKQVGQIDVTTGKRSTLPEGMEQIKLITGGRFAWFMTRQGKLLASAGGTYTLTNDAYTEKVTFVSSDSYKHLMGKSFAYPLMLEDGKWHLKATFQYEGGGEMPIDEFWERCP